MTSGTQSIPVVRSYSRNAQEVVDVSTWFSNPKRLGVTYTLEASPSTVYLDGSKLMDKSTAAGVYEFKVISTVEAVFS